MKQMTEAELKELLTKAWFDGFSNGVESETEEPVPAAVVCEDYVNEQMAGL